MVEIKKRFMILPLISLLILTACNIPVMKNASLVIALATYTVEASKTRMPTTTSTSTPTETSTSTPTQTQTPTATATFTVTATETITATPTDENCNLAEFVRDVNYPDGSYIFAGTDFDKTWRLRNIGSCTWTPAYRVVFTSGYRMGSPYSISFTDTDVEPGDSVDITLPFTSPETTGYYSASFMLKSADGETFGVGSDGTTAFWVKIYSASYADYVTSTPTSTPVTPKPPPPRPPQPNPTPMPPPVTGTPPTPDPGTPPPPPPPPPP